MKKKFKRWLERLRANRRHDRGVLAELDKALRHPLPKTDEALCQRIVAAARVADQSQRQAKPDLFGNWTMIMTRAATALAVLVVILLWVQPWEGETTDLTNRHDGVASLDSIGEGSAPAEGEEIAFVQREQAYLKIDTQRIAAFLQRNLRL